MSDRTPDEIDELSELKAFFKERGFKFSQEYCIYSGFRYCFSRSFIKFSVKDFGVIDFVPPDVFIAIEDVEYRYDDCIPNFKKKQMSEYEKVSLRCHDGRWSIKSRKEITNIVIATFDRRLNEALLKAYGRLTYCGTKKASQHPIKEVPADIKPEVAKSIWQKFLGV